MLGLFNLGEKGEIFKNFSKSLLYNLRLYSKIYHHSFQRKIDVTVTALFQNHPKNIPYLELASLWGPTYDSI